MPAADHLFLRRYLTLHQIMVLGFTVNRLPGFVSVLPWLGPHQHWVFALIVSVSTLANSLCAVAWSASMSDLVPLHIRGRYFVRRNGIFGFWTLVVVLAAGYLAEHYQNSLQVFGVIFACAAMLRMIGLLFLTRMKFPLHVTTRRQEHEVWRVSLRSAKPRLSLAGALHRFVGIRLNLGMPFYSVYVLRDLHFSMHDLTVLTTLTSLGGLLSLPTWGILADRFGNKPVLMACAFLWVVVALLAWALAGPDRYAHLFVNYFSWARPRRFHSASSI